MRLASEHSAWLSWSIPRLAIEGMGSQGTFRKRPKLIKIDRDGGVDGDGQTLLLQLIAKVMSSGRRAQDGQETALLESLLPRKQGG
jgi:hypothetical protein